MIKFENWKVSRYKVLQYFVNTLSHSVFLASEMGMKNQQRTVVVHRQVVYDDELEEYREIDLRHKYQDHPNIVRCFDSFFTQSTTAIEYYVVNEYCTYGKLEDYEARNPEEQKCLISDLAYGMEYIYESLHLKTLGINPSTIYVTRNRASPSPTLKVKVPSFKLVCPSLNDLFLQDICYSPPEWYYNGTYENSLVWTIGLVMYFVLTGIKPSVESVMDRLQTFDFCFDFTLVKSDDLRNLLKTMLVADPQQRVGWEFLKNVAIYRCKEVRDVRTSNDVKKYSFLNKIDQGNYGVVYGGQMHDGADSALVAIKEIKPKHVESLLREVRTMRMCKHPNLVEYLDYFVIDQPPHSQRHFLVMEYCELGTLEEYLVRNGPLSRECLLHFLVDICKGLFYLHFKKNIIHRDLKPANFLLTNPTNQSTPYPTLKISDYGFARTFSSEKQILESRFCTPLYASPQLLFGKTYTTKSDLYSVGVIIYQMATNQFPFTNNNDTFLEKMKHHEPVSVPAFVDPDITRLIKDMVVFDEDKRIGWNEFYCHPCVEMAFLQEGIRRDEIDVPSSQQMEMLDSMVLAMSEDHSDCDPD